jgi:hypothetical protein
MHDFAQYGKHGGGTGPMIERARRCNLQRG